MKFLTAFIAFISFLSFSQDLSEIRVAYKEAAKDQEKVDAFYNIFLEINKKDDVVLVAYKGASITLKAKHAKTIKEKKDGFIEGVSYIEFAIEEEPNAIEPRFIRLGIQENSPKILKYKDHINEDKNYILKQYQFISSKDLKYHIKEYILQSNVFTDEEKQSISNQ